MSQPPDQTPRGLPRLLTVAEVMGRYGLRDRRAARRVMDAAGAFRIGGRLLVRLEDILAHEERQIAARAQPPPSSPTASQPTRWTRASTVPRAPLAPGWWRQDP